jgi:hypothetical protein
MSHEKGLLWNFHSSPFFAYLLEISEISVAHSPGMGQAQTVKTVWGPNHLKCSGEMNSPSAEVLLRKTLVRR